MQGARDLIPACFPASHQRHRRIAHRSHQHHRWIAHRSHHCHCWRCLITSPGLLRQATTKNVFQCDPYQRKVTKEISENTNPHPNPSPKRIARNGVFDAGVFLDTPATHSKNFYDVSGHFPIPISLKMQLAWH